MGIDIQKANFTDEDFFTFSQKLREETKVLKRLFQENIIEDNEELKCGIEVEAWICDQNFLPTPSAQVLLQQINNPLVVPEISKFNFELNNLPCAVGGNLISNVHNQLLNLWNECKNIAHKHDWKPIMIGSLPTIENEMLTLDNLFPIKRYFALNEQIFNYRKQLPLSIDIEGEEHLHVAHQDVMLEAAATSVQFHLQVPAQQSAHYYNASLLVSPFMAALAANAPFLFGKSLWEETRIPIFEQGVYLESYPRLVGRRAKRVTFGPGYLKNSLLELFLENLSGYPILLPIEYPYSPEKLKHLCLHNGTIWRWNRPIIGFNSSEVPHVRIEHRVPSSGPSPIDIVANLAAYLGMVTFIVDEYSDFTHKLSFETLRSGFYNACKFGLRGECYWINNKKVVIQDLLSEFLLPNAQKSLLKLGVDKADVESIFQDVLLPRVRTGQTGSFWQKSFTSTYGKKFQDLLEIYYNNQVADKPIHLWTT